MNMGYSPNKIGTLYDELKALGNYSLSYHDDADGVYSASLLMLAQGLNVKKMKASQGDERLDVHSPPFNEYETDVAVDLGSPAIKTWKGIAIDHHPDHPKDRTYKLYWDHVPTGLIVWNHLKDYIPKDQWWRVVGSLMGDASVELTPPEIWDNFPNLFDEKGSVYKDKWDINFSRYPVYIYLSSGINAFCRNGDPLGALRACLRWKTPMDAVTDKEAAEQKRLLEGEEMNVMKNKPIAEIINNRFVILQIRTTGNKGMSGYIASKLSNNQKYRFLTIIVANEYNGEVSIRGTLAKYLADKLHEIGYKAGGHACACGATIPPDEIDEFINEIRKIGRNDRT